MCTGGTASSTSSTRVCARKTRLSTPLTFLQRRRWATWGSALLRTDDEHSSPTFVVLSTTWWDPELNWGLFWNPGDDECGFVCLPWQGNPPHFPPLLCRCSWPCSQVLLQQSFSKKLSPQPLQQWANIWSFHLQPEAAVGEQWYKQPAKPCAMIGNGPSLLVRERRYDMCQSSQASWCCHFRWHFVSYQCSSLFVCCYWAFTGIGIWYHDIMGCYYYHRNWSTYNKFGQILGGLIVLTLQTI